MYVLRTLNHCLHTTLIIGTYLFLVYYITFMCPILCIWILQYPYDSGCIHTSIMIPDMRLVFPTCGRNLAHSCLHFWWSTHALLVECKWESDLVYRLSSIHWNALINLHEHILTGLIHHAVVYCELPLGSLIPRPSHLQFLIACNMQKRRGKA